jgi:hypothetical protein
MLQISFELPILARLKIKNHIPDVQRQHKPCPYIQNAFFDKKEYIERRHPTFLPPPLFFTDSKSCALYPLQRNKRILPAMNYEGGEHENAGRHCLA